MSEQQEMFIVPADRRQHDRRAGSHCVHGCTLHIEIEEIKSAFPDGPLKHREAHEAWMEAKRAEKEFYDNMKKAIMEKGITGFFTLIIIIIGLALTGLLTKLGLTWK